jgi:DNA-binding winged helix-turn-helix (wHTH) protein
MDVASHRLCRGRRDIRLRPKSWDILCYLVERAGLLVTREALHREIWPDTVVSGDRLTQSIMELRRALGDESRAPRFIETLHALGFRFIAPVTGSAGESPGGAASSEAAGWTVPSTVPGPALPFEERQVELSRLDNCLSRAHGGVRQGAFVTGEAGIGKTALVIELSLLHKTTERSFPEAEDRALAEVGDSQGVGGTDAQLAGEVQ